MPAKVLAVCSRDRHGVGKDRVGSVRLLVGHGVEGDAHAGSKVQHLSRIRRDPAQPNLRQVHLIPAELFDELAAQGFRLGHGDMGENITTRGIALLELPTGSRLRLGQTAIVELTGLRTPCRQLDGLQVGLMAACLDHDATGEPAHRAGVMAVVVRGGEVRAGDAIACEPPASPHHRLRPV